MTGPKKDQDKRSTSASDREDRDERESRSRDNLSDRESRRSRAEVEGDEDIADEESFSPDDVEEKE
jgi:hypothetical protein